MQYRIYLVFQSLYAKADQNLPAQVRPQSWSIVPSLRGILRLPGKLEELLGYYSVN